MSLTKLYTADFETTTNPNDCRVWGWGLYDIVKDKYEYGTTIDDFFERIFKLPNKSKVYFHNLKFDGEFIFYYLFKNGFEHTNDRKVYNKQFSTLITFMGVFYSIKFKYKGKEITIFDSLKIIPLPVSKIGKAFNLEQSKGEIDYTMERPIGYKITPEEVEYIKNDVEIVGKALRQFFEQGLTKMTQASNAFKDFKKIMGAKRFSKLFPVLPFDKELRQSYKGGFSYVNPKFQNKEIGEGLVLDVNSLYPSVMYYKKLPYGEPIFYEGKYVEDNVYDLYIQVIRCNFEIKENHIPTLQLKNMIGFKPTEYVTSSNGLDVTLCLTSVDLELFMKHYEVYNLEYFNGWKFKSTDKLFKKYIDKWKAVKEESTITGNSGMRTLSKLMLNSLYGKFALNPIVKNKFPQYDGKLVHYQMGQDEHRDSIYVPVASFITSYARNITISSAQENFERFIYADTDSLHLTGLEEPKNIDIDQIRLGAWKVEYTFKRGRFLRAKSYIEELEDGSIHIACAGLPQQCRNQVTFDNFKNGLVVNGKLQHCRVEGGVVLKPIDFTIKI